MRVPRYYGFASIELGIYAALAVLICAAIYIAKGWLDDYGDEKYAKGLADKQVEWDQDKERAAELERRREAAAAEALLAEKKKAEAAAARAADYDTKRKEAEREARRNHGALVACKSARPAAAPVAPLPDVAGEPAGSNPGQADVAGDRGDDPRLLWRLVGLLDGAYTGLDGEPVSGLAAQLAGDPARADAASPYTADDLVEVVNDNARKLSACRRDVAAIRAKVEALADSWDRENKNR